LLALGRWQEATEALTKAVAADGNAAPLLFNLGYAELGAGAAQQAAAHLRRAVELKQDDPRLYYYLAFAWDELQEGDRAEQALAQALALNPTHRESLGLSAHIQIQRGRIEQARQTLKRLLENHPVSIEGLWLQGQLEMLNFNAQKALEYLNRAQQLAPNDVDTLMALGQANLMLQRATAARKVLSRAVMLDATQALAQVALGWACLFEDDLPAAGTAFTLALNVDPDLADAHAGQAIVYLGRGETARAKAALAQAKRLDPSNLTALLVEAGMAGQQGNAAAARWIMDELMQVGSFSHAGWSNRELVERGQQSATGKHVSAKWTRYLRQQQRRKLVAGPGPSRLH
jgi:tetratricopeptide (TPR) repeat protein